MPKNKKLYMKMYMKEYRESNGNGHTSFDRIRKYGCGFCADKNSCSCQEKCKYAEELDKHKKYSDYDRKARNMEVAFER